MFKSYHFLTSNEPLIAPISSCDRGSEHSARICIAPVRTLTSGRWQIRFYPVITCETDRQTMSLTIQQIPPQLDSCCSDFKKRKHCNEMDIPWLLEKCSTTACRKLMSQNCSLSLVLGQAVEGNCTMIIWCIFLANLCCQFDVTIFIGLMYNRRYYLW